MPFNHNRFPFKRKTTDFNGGDCPRNAFDLGGRHDYEEPGPVTIVKCQNEDEDLWQVRNAKGENLSVYGHDMHPHPDAPETNVEAITRLMEDGSTVMVQAFIMEAAMKYAEATLADEAETRRKMEGGFIGAQTWIDTAKEVQDFLGQHLRPKR